MSVFFQLVSVFALFFGIAGVVYGTEVSKRCRQQINDRLGKMDKKMSRRANEHEAMIKRVIQSVHETMAKLEETELSQSREIIAIRNGLKPLLEDFEKRLEQQKKIETLQRIRRNG